jgi:hypothetical protein
LDPNTSFLPEYWIRKIFLTSIEITGKKKKKKTATQTFSSPWPPYFHPQPSSPLLHQPTMATTAATPTRKPPPLDQNLIMILRVTSILEGHKDNM